MSGGERTALADSRLRVLNALRDMSGPAPIAAVAAAVGLHPNTVREHLEVLAEQGRVTASTERSGSRGRPRTLYQLTAMGALSTDPGVETLRLAGIILEAFGQDEAKARVTAVAAGARWGEEVAGTLADVAAPVERMLIALEVLGAAPTLEGAVVDGLGCVHVEHCPFHALAAVRPDVVCAIHAAAIERVANGPGRADVTATVRRATGHEGGACVVELSHAQAVQAPPERT